MIYPRRDSHFAHRFVRVLQKSCAAQDIGRDAVLLLCFISHTEDAARYSGPVRFWNSQLEETMGFTTPKQLNNARHRACEAGWLNYERRGTRAVGEYFVTIPERFFDLTDAPIEETGETSILSPTGKNSGTNEPAFFPNGERIREESRKEFDKNSGKLSYPSPIPNPNTNTSCSEGVKRPSLQTQPQIDPQSVNYPDFPCLPGKIKGPWLWTLTDEYRAQLHEIYPHLDIENEGRKAINWLKLNPSKRKTHVRMAGWFAGVWLERAQQKLGGNVAAASKQASQPRRKQLPPLRKEST